MTGRNHTTYLVLLCFFSLGSLAVIQNSFIRQEVRGDATKMRAAVSLASKWFDIIEEIKQEKGIQPDRSLNIAHAGMLGDEFSEITTTLGSLEAKELALNPDFAALMVRLLDDAGIDSTSRVGLTLSGSFPSLAISSLAALQTVGAHVVMASSIGASMYGANQAEATWIDMEQWLREKGGLRYHSELVTMGAEGDSGGGLLEDGIPIFKRSAKRNGVTLFVPSSLDEAIAARMQILENPKIDLLINIGGNQANLGGCVHAYALPNGYHRSIATCNDSDRGVLVRMSEKGVPVIHLLNIKELAARYHIPSNDAVLYHENHVEALPVIFTLVSICAGLTGILYRSKTEYLSRFRKLWL